MICIDTRMAFHTGIGTYIRNIIPKLPFKKVLIAAEKWTDDPCILTSAPIYSMEEQLKLPFLIPECDLFWSPHYNIPLAPIRAKKRLTTIHDTCHLTHPQNWHKKLYAKTMLCKAARLSDHILTNSEFSKSEIIRHTQAPEEKITVAHLGVDSSRFFPTDEEKEKFFLYVGSRAPHKNIDRLLEAWEKISPEWELKMSPFSDEELPSLYQKAYALIHPSFYEGFGLTPLEAMSSGCPTVVSNRASLPEVCGPASLYFDPYSVDEIASAIRQLIENQTLHIELKEKGLERSRRFSWDKTVQKHIEILENLL